MNRIVIGIAGGTGSGKTTVASKIWDSFKSDAVMLSQDNYYKIQKGKTLTERSLQNYDDPDAIETSILIQNVKDLKNGKAITHPVYNFKQHLREKDWAKLEPKKLIIVEGILVFENDALCSLFDLKLFVDTDADIRFIRRVKRDVATRKRTLDSVIEQYVTMVKPMHQKFVEPSRKKADIIIPEGGYNNVAMDLILQAVNKMLNEKSEKK